LESAYERCLLHELILRGIKAERQVVQPIHYKDLALDEAIGSTSLLKERLFWS
jgi:GxxExxY protein